MTLVLALLAAYFLISILAGLVIGPVISGKEEE